MEWRQENTCGLTSVYGGVSGAEELGQKNAMISSCADLR